MKTLILSDSSKENIGQVLEDELIRKFKDNNYDYTHYNVKNAEIKKCIGCFSCWLKTPGVCIFNDVAKAIRKADINSDVYIILTEIKYGGYSKQIKRVIDRSIGKILPFFKDVNGEMHHAPRYERYPELIFIGYCSDISFEEEETFKEINKAVSINFQKNAVGTYICKNVSEVEALISDIFQSVKEKEDIL